MVPKTARKMNDTPESVWLYMALELSSEEWKLGFTIGFGQAPRLRSIQGGGLTGLRNEIRLAKERFGLDPSTRNQSFAGLCGPWIRPLAFRHVAQMTMQNPTLPIAGGGGLMTWEHTVQMIMYGAKAITYCTLLYKKGHKIIPRIAKKLLQFMEDKRYETIDDFRGCALKYIVTPDKVQYVYMLPEVNESLCNGCGTCVSLGHYEVFALENDKAKVVAPRKCYSCAVCYWLCPKKAIQMVEPKDASLKGPYHQ